jgi:signal transduction histidine kinase/ActR/RegA family two-component response regulator
VRIRAQSLGALLDGRLAAVGVQAFRMGPTRLVLVAVLVPLAGIAVGWPVASAWGAAILASEAWVLLATRPMAQGKASRATLWNYFWSTAVGAPLWTAFGLILWSGHSHASPVAAAAFWCGQLLYAQNFCVKSPVAAVLLGGPSVAAPLLIPLLLPRFAGADQAMVVSMLCLCVAHAVNAAIDNIRTNRKLEAATQALVAGKQAAEAAGAEMAVAKTEAELANQAKSTFLATMSHEIRTPLNGVLGMTQAMAADKLSTVQRGRLDVVRRSGEALLNVLNDVLDLAKIEAGRLDLEEIEFDLGDLVRSAQSGFSALAQDKGLTLALDIEAARGLYRGDPNRVSQILRNLISNALKFTERGEVRVIACLIPGGIALTVADSGVGMDEEALCRIFSPFAQADTSTTRRYGGTGLGLSICWELAQLMGGEISATSEPGAGSRFTVTLPLARVGEAAATPAIVAPPAPEPNPQLSVLVAEDNAVNQLVIKTLLGQAGIDPVVVDDGRQAVEAWRAGTWDLILMDVQMPVMDGSTATQEIRRLEAELGKACTPILALTANAMAHQVAEYAAIGMDGHVAKPIRIEQLFSAIQAALAVPPADATEAAA